MAFRFRRSVRLLPGIRLNLSKSGPSISLGPRGAKITLGSRGIRRTIGIPGTGIHWTENQSWSKKQKPAHRIDNSPLSGEIVSISSSEQLENLIRTGVTLSNPDTGRKFTQAQLQKKLRDFQTQERRTVGQDVIDKEMKELADLIGIVNSLQRLRTLEDWKKELNRREYVLPRFERDPVPNLEHFVAEARKAGSPLRYMWTPLLFLLLPFMSVILAAKGTIQYQFLHLILFAAASLAVFAGLSTFILSRYKGWKVRTQEEAERKHQEEHADYASELQEHERTIEQERVEWETSESTRISLLERLLAGQTETMEDVIEEALKELEFPFDTDASFQVLDERAVALDVDLPEIEDVIPTDEPVLMKNGEIKRKKRTKALVNRDYAKTVTGLAYYFAHDVFESCPTVQSVLVSAFTQRVSRKTGNTEDQYVYSVVMERERFSRLNFSEIDPVEGLQNFNHVMEIGRDNLLKTINPPDPLQQATAYNLSRLSLSEDLSA